MVFPREVLNRLKLSEERSLDDVVIYYLHRGAPGINGNSTYDRSSPYGC